MQIHRLLLLEMSDALQTVIGFSTATVDMKLSLQMPNQHNQPEFELTMSGITDRYRSTMPLLYNNRDTYMCLTEQLNFYLNYTVEINSMVSILNTLT